jgi:hypothetical protein
VAEVKASSVAPSASASIPPRANDHVSGFPFNNSHPAAPEPMFGWSKPSIGYDVLVTYSDIILRFLCCSQFMP